MNVLTGLLVICAVAWNADALRCRRCIGAISLADCTFSIPCGADELCYMDQIVTDQLSIEYNGGCRARDIKDDDPTTSIEKGFLSFVDTENEGSLKYISVCLRSPGQIGKRNLIMCSKCCSNDDCGTSLCNIPSSTTINNIDQCYQCTGVTDMNQCNGVMTCQSDEMCNAETFRLGGQDSYSAGCINKRLCTLLTQEALKRRKECDIHPDPFLCGNHGKRQAGAKVCTACCGDGTCNGDTCENLLDRLYKLWSAGVLDINTLKTISTATISYTSTTYASVSST